jgi:uncharacterized protein (DUF111 family)
MTEKKKPDSKRAATTQRFSEVAKEELGIEVKLLLQLTEDFLQVHPEFKDYIYLNGKKPSPSSNLNKLCRKELTRVRSK